MTYPFRLYQSGNVWGKSGGWVQSGDGITSGIDSEPLLVRSGEGQVG